MAKQAPTFARRLGGWLTRFAAFLEGIDRPTTSHAKFVNLAPTDYADKDGVYSEALLFATTDPKVKNIALTGPYGSGKSSIIQSFLKRHRRSSLHISLAAFATETGPGDREARPPSPKVSRQEIERSILQQMLYGADANRLPLSRFKRIQSPGVLSIFKSLYITFGLLSLAYIFTKNEEIISGTFFKPIELSNWPIFFVFIFSMIFLWAALHHLYVASFGLSLKSISLRDIEIRPASDNLDSILNRHLDEIVYFFQRTNYDLVIFEDLDRFEDSEIFVTLREINSLLNANAGIRRTIRFIYALRDDFFINTDRTKFFEFVIPVIPIINASNSIDMVLEQGKRLALDNRLDRQFLREASRYLDDLRLIQNIFNEYAIYVENLKADKENILDANKLLAVLIYKNVYPRDFEQLHRGRGNLAYILGRHDEFVAEGEAAYKAEIAELELNIEIAERQTPHDLKELRQIYATALVERLPTDTAHVSFDGQNWITIPQLVSNDGFEQLWEYRYIHCRNIHNHRRQFDINLPQSGLDSKNSYFQRKVEIERKTEANRSEIAQRIRELRAKIATVRTAKFDELVRLSASRGTDLFDGFGEKGELARFLVLEGHLDDTYYQYTSLFHSGRLSPNDNKFLIQIRAFFTPDPDFQIDNPSEVIAAMRETDFGQSYILNIKLVDFLFNDASRYSDQTRKFSELIASHFEACEDFLEAYYATGSTVPKLLSRLADEWEQFVPTAIASKRNLSHITQLVTNVPEGTLGTLARGGDELSDFVAERLPEILALAPDLAPERLERIGFEVRDLPAIGRFARVVRFIARRGLFELSIANLEHVYHEVMGETDIRAFRVRNYTTLRSLADSALITRVERNLNSYLSDVLLELHDNFEEDAAAITDLLGREELDEDKLHEFLCRQTTVLPTLMCIPEKFHATVFELQRIAPTWDNCISFMASGGFAADTLVAYLDQTDVQAVLLDHRLRNDPETVPLRQFLISANALSDESYLNYIRELPKTFENFPDYLDSTKLKALISYSTVTFSKTSLERLDAHADLQVLFVANNIEAYLADPAMFGLDDVFLERLLQAEISDDHKREVIDLFNLDTLTELPDRAALLGPILDRTNVQVSGIDAAKARMLILYSRPVETQISLLNKLHSIMTIDEARAVLTALPDPFCEITKGYHSPRLACSDENRALVQWLEARGIISSWREVGSWFGGDVIRVHLKRR